MVYCHLGVAKPTDQETIAAEKILMLMDPKRRGRALLQMRHQSGCGGSPETQARTFIVVSAGRKWGGRAIGLGLTIGQYADFQRFCDAGAVSSGLVPGLGSLGQVGGEGTSKRATQRVCLWVWALNRLVCI